MSVEFTGHRAELKGEFIRNRGYWSDFWDSLLAANPEFFEAYLRYSSLPWTAGVLEPKVKEFVYIAIDVATTHLYEPGLRIHFANALRHGATAEELMEVVMLCGPLGVQTFEVGVPILIEELDRAGRGGEINRQPGPDQARLRSELEHVQGYWPSVFDGFVAMDPHFFEAYLRLAAAPWRNGVLPARVKEFVLIAVNASVTHLYRPALRHHVRQALAHGATATEIMEVYQLTSVLGMHSCTMGVPVLTAELGKTGGGLSQGK